MLPRAIVMACLLLLGALHATAQETSLTNPTKRQYKYELARLLTPAPGPGGSFIVTEDGVEVPYQVEEIDGRNWIWVCSSFEPGAWHKYQVTPGKPKAAPPKVTVRKDGEVYLLDNGIVAVRLPAEAANAPPGPISSLKLGDKWVGGSFWHTALPLQKFTASVVGAGTILGKVRLRYEFNGLAGSSTGLSPVVHGQDAHATFDVSLGPGWSHAEVFEQHEMARGDYWEFEASKGWSPRQGVSKPFSSGAGSGLVVGKVEPQRELKPGGLPYQREDLFINLFPRWNQHYKDGWYFAATDGASCVGAVAVRASQWIWPHDNSIQAVVKESGDYAGLRAGTWKGQRLWWLFAAASAAGTDSQFPNSRKLVSVPAAPCNVDYVARYAWESLDKLNHEFILDWPGQKGQFSGMNFYDGGQMNPSGGIRGAGKRAMAEAGKAGDISTLTRAQVMFHPDAYGSYWNFWSPENPNFFTDFMRVPIALTAGLKSHPRFEELRKTAEAKFKEDMEHSITLPGGAGQECPGYVGYALRNWGELAAVCKQHLGFDPTAWERYKAAQYFEKRITQPDGGIRRTLPMGDTHPAKEGGPAPVDVPAAEVAKFTTEELPGFGVVFNHKPGTAQETYLAFKSGPNRGHYHGDQLSFHYCANAKALAVDHHCSYHPRAGQEHMHNRLAFHTDQFPYANSDGYERLIAFKTSPAVDIAVGQVESERLRQVEKLPPEIWHQEYPQHQFARPLIYRRTIVFMKSAPQDYFVIRDQFWASEPLAATFCLHVLSEKTERQGQTVDFGNLTLCCVHPATFDFESFPWSHDNGGLEATQGARLTIRGAHGEFITVLFPEGGDRQPISRQPADLGRLPAGGVSPRPNAVPGGVKVGEDEIIFSGDQPAAGDGAACVVVKRAGQDVLALTGKDIDLNRSQGDIGLFVPDAGYPFGEIPDWLIQQRAKR